MNSYASVREHNNQVRKAINISGSVAPLCFHKVGERSEFAHDLTIRIGKIHDLTEIRQCDRCRVQVVKALPMG